MGRNNSVERRIASCGRTLWGFAFAFILLCGAFGSEKGYAAINVTVAAPGGKASQSLPDAGGTFDMTIPLNRNAVNKLTVTATDDYGRTAAQELAITQVSLDQVVVSKITSQRLSVEQVEQLVNDGVIDLANPENYNVSIFDIVLTIDNKPVPISVPIVLPEGEYTGWENIRLPQESGGGNPQPSPVEVVVFEKVIFGPPGEPSVTIPGVLVIEGRIKSLKEFFSVRLLLINTSGIFTLDDVTANIEFPNGGLTSILPADGIISLGSILPGDGEVPGQKEKEWIIRGDAIGVRDVKVNFGGFVTGPGIPAAEPIAFNGSAVTNVEVKGPPTFDVQVSHPDHVVYGVPYELKVEITNTADIAAMYASLSIDMGADGQLVHCGLNAAGEPACTPIDGADERRLGHILPGETVTEVFTVNPLKSGTITSCMAAADQNLSLRVLVGTIGCMVGELAPNRGQSDGSPAVTILPAPSADGIHTDSPVVAFFSKIMNTASITTGPDGTFNVYDSSNTRVTGQLRFDTLHDRTIAIWQTNDGVTNRLKGNAEYKVQLRSFVLDLDGKQMANEWISSFRTTGTGQEDVTPPTLTLSIKPPVDANYVLPGQIVKVDAYAADQGSAVARVEARLKDMSEAGAKFLFVDQKTVFEGDLPPFIFTIDSANLVPGHTYQLMGTAFDGNGNLRDATISFVVAETAEPPAISLPVDPADPVLHGISIDVTPTACTGAVRQVSFYLDNAAAPFKTATLAPYQARLNTLGLSLGAHTVKAVAADPLGQFGQDSFSFTLAENLNMPVVSFPGQENGTQYVEGANVLISGRAEDPTGIETMKYFIDDPNGAPVFVGTAPILLQTTGLSLGGHKVYVEATNSLGVSNRVNDPASFISFSIFSPPPGLPPAPPVVTNILYPEGGLVTVDGISAAQSRIDVTNLTNGIVMSATADSGGVFHRIIEAASGDILRLVAYDFSQSQDPSGPTDVTVPAPPVLDHVSVVPDTITFTGPNQAQDLIVTAYYNDGSKKNVTAQSAFSSSNASVAAVSAGGRVAGLSLGMASITVKFGDIDLAVQVNANIILLESISVSPPVLNFVALNQTFQLVVTGRYNDGSSGAIAGAVSYAVGDTSILSVASSGLVTAKANGSTTISVGLAGVAPAVVEATVNTILDPSPTISILSPLSGTLVERGELVSVTVRGQDAIGGVAKIFFDVSGASSFSEIKQISPVLLDLTSSFVFPVSANAQIGGSIQVQVWAEDSSGHLSDISTILLGITDKTSPSVIVVEPAQQAAYNFGDMVQITAQAIDAVGVTQIRFETSGALNLTETKAVVPTIENAQAQFSFKVPFGLQNPNLRIHIYAMDAAGNQGLAIPVDVILTDADITAPATIITGVSDPGSSASSTVSFQITDGLSDLDFVELYFRRNGIGTFNLYTGPLGDGDGKYRLSSGAAGTIVFDSTRMGGDGDFEFYTVGVDRAANKELSPVNGAGGIVPDASATFSVGTSWAEIKSVTNIAEGNFIYDNRNLRIDGAAVTIAGAHSFRNVELLNGAVLTHPETDQTNAYGININVWSLTVDSTSSINVTGRGYLGGDRSGAGASGHTASFLPGAQGGNGGSYGGAGGHYSGAAGAPNPVYGNVINPVDLGSGGGSWGGAGGDGGGRILIGAINVMVDGSMIANGGESLGTASGDGSGGSINITTRTLSGKGVIHSDGGGLGNQTGGGGGRIAIRNLDLSTYAIEGITTRGGNGYYGSGADGTIVLLEEGKTNGELVLNGQGASSSPFTDLLLPAGQVFDSITLQNGARVTAIAPIIVNGELRLRGGSLLTHSNSNVAGLQISAGRVVVEKESSIDVTGRGYPGGDRSPHGARASTVDNLPGSYPGNGGAYGGYAAHYSGAGANGSNSVYGDLTRPSLLGSGGGSWSGAGGNGGGYVRIVATDAVVVDGSIRANGGESLGTASGDGSGGSIWISTSKLAGTGEISADGGGLGNHTGGSGGRIALYVDYIEPANDFDGLKNVTALRGRGYYDSLTGGSGTLFVKYSNQQYGNLIVDDKIVDGTGVPNGTAPNATPLQLIGFGTARSVGNNTISTDGKIVLPMAGLAGLRLNPDVSQNESFEIVANTQDTITVATPNENGVLFSSVAHAGDTYAGSYIFDNVLFRRGGHLEVGDILNVVDTLDLREFGLLTHPETTNAYEARLDLSVRTLFVDPTSRIDVTGRGYLGGDRSGLSNIGHTAGFAPGAQTGSGGSYGGLGGHYGGAGANNQPNQPYGSIMEPSQLGSGGGSWSGAGGDGGGRIFLRATNMTINGAIRANGAESFGIASGDGSGGSIWIVTSTLAGTGTISADGGGLGNQTGGGGGRIAIDFSDSLTFSDTNISAVGGVGYYGIGGDGTIFIRRPGQVVGDLVIDGKGLLMPYDMSLLDGGLVFDNITLRNKARVTANHGVNVSDTLRITGGSVLNHSAGNEAGLQINARRVVVEQAGLIDVTGLGYPGGDRSPYGSTASTLGNLPGAQTGNGGSYGGRGAHYSGSGATASNLVYGDPARPDLLGSGGGSWSGAGGSGGGYVRIKTSEELVVDGDIRANGGTSFGTASGNGSGGSIWLETSILSGTGTISADGGGQGNQVGGGGGRIAIYLDQLDNNADLMGLRNVTAFRGRGYYDSSAGSAGTIYVKYANQELGTLIVDDNMVDGNGLPNATSLVGTPLPLIGFGIAGPLTADTLTTDGIVRLPANGLAGLRLNPDTAQGETFEILSNIGSTITVVTPNENGMAFSDVAHQGASYAGSYVYDNVLLRRGGHLEVGDLLRVAGQMDIAEYGLLTHPETTQNYEARLHLTVGTLFVDQSGRIDVSGRGYLGGDRSGAGGNGHTLGFAAGAQSGNGGSYGGIGGHYSGSGATQPNPVYGDIPAPDDLGSGGGSWSGAGGDGGGRVFINAGEIMLDGAIMANGGESAGSASGDGSGGSVWISTSALDGIGRISADGGGANNQTGGGGGRIAVHYDTFALDVNRITAGGGVGYYGNGAAGTLFLEQR